MRSLLSFSALVLVTAAVSAQSSNCLLYYKFDHGTGDAVNWGTELLTSKVRSGSTGPSIPWVIPGWFGSAMLRGSANTSATHFWYCETGFKAGFKGDFTVHWWMKERQRVGTDVSYVFGGLGGTNGFRCSTNGPAGGTLWISGFNASTENIVMPTVTMDLQSRARATSGVCVSCVVKTASGKTTAQWYVDGMPHGTAQTLSGPPSVASSTSDFKIGKHVSDTSSSVWDIDEFRLCNYAASGSEIMKWCIAPSAADAQWDLKSRCRITLGSTGGPPRFGNADYAHTIQGPEKEMEYMFVAGNRGSPGLNMFQVFPSLQRAGCQWHVNFDIVLFGCTDSKGRAVIKNPVPNRIELIGVLATTQCFGVTKGTPPFAHLSNPMAHAIERN